MNPLFLLLALAGAASAQQPITMNLGGETALPTKFVIEDVQSKRFSDKDLPGKSFLAGDAVQVLFETNQLIRIKKGNNFGWVPAATVSDEAPAPPELPLDAPGLPPATP